MALRIRIDGHPGRRFAEVIRALPDGRSWLVSDVEGAVVIARSEGALLREAILSEGDAGTWDVECLASEGVSELALQALVLTAIVAAVTALFAVWWAGYDGVFGLLVGFGAAAMLPALVLAVGAPFVDPGRDEGAEAHLERALRFAIATVAGADLILGEGATEAAPERLSTDG